MEKLVNSGRVNMSDLWIIFIRMTSMIAWAVIAWSISILISLQTGQAIVLEKIVSLEKRVGNLEARNMALDMEELARLRKLNK